MAAEPPNTKLMPISVNHNEVILHKKKTACRLPLSYGSEKINVM